MDKELKRAIIVDNYQNPINRGLVDDKNYIKHNSSATSCIDNIDIAVKFEDDIIKDIRFDGEACAISTSATSIMIHTFIGKSIEEAKEIIKNYENMIEEREYDSNILEELIVYDDIYMQANRKNCALLPIEGLKKIIEEYELKEKYNEK